MAHPWKDLIVWQKSHDFVLSVYILTSTFPEKERFGLCQQLRRSASSVAAAYLYNSRGSLEESRYHLLLSKDLKYIDSEQYEKLEKLATEVSFLLNKLIATITR